MGDSPPRHPSETGGGPLRAGCGGGGLLCELGLDVLIEADLDSLDLAVLGQEDLLDEKLEQRFPLVAGAGAEKPVEVQTPDFRTINRFCSERMKDVLQKVFTAILELLVTEGYVKLEHYFVDGTKMEANANRYTFVWGKAVVRQKAKLQEKVKTLFEQIKHWSGPRSMSMARQIWLNWGRAQS